jgi:hypothetical protein
VLSTKSGEAQTPALINADLLASRVIGAAHVVSITPAASERLSDMLGKDYSVFNSAVRTYNPGLNPEEDLPSRHPVASPATIAGWDGIGPSEFETFLVRGVLRRSTGRDFEGDIPPYSLIHQLELEDRRQKANQRGATSEELLNLALAEIEILRKKLEDDAATNLGLLREAEKERDDALTELDDKDAEIGNLHARLASVLAALARIGPEEEIPIPSTFDEIDTWCRTHLPGDIIVLPRALRAAKKSSFHDPSLTYRALLLLRNEYMRMRKTGSDESLKEWRDELARLGLEDQASFSGDRAGEFENEYTVQWRKRRRLLDRHLKAGNSREERYCFRLYYFWDAEEQKVVIGSFPCHLRTRVT